MSNILSYVFCFGIWPWLLGGLLGLLLGWLLFRGKKQAGDLTIEGEGQIRAEADSLRARVNELEGGVNTRDGEISGLKSKLAAAVAGAAVGAAATAGSSKSDGVTTANAVSGGADDDETYALEWRNRYLAARVKYLEGRISDTPKATKKSSAKKTAAKKRVVKKVVKKTSSAKATTGAASLTSSSKSKSKRGASAKKTTAKKVTAKKTATKKVATKKAAPKKKATSKKKTVRKSAAKRTAKPRVLYDKPTDGKPDDLKLISGVGPKLEKMLNKTGVYYFRQVGNWKKADVKMVNDKLGAFPGRIERDEWVRQAKGLAKGGSAGNASKAKPAKKASAKKPPAKKTASKKVAKPTSPNAKYLADVRKYDPKASSAVIDNIVKYCGIALRSRDGSLVACSQEHELDTIAKGFATKKLGLTSGQIDVVKSTCEEMKGTRFKNRVTFYYLMAKKARKMKVFR